MTNQCFTSHGTSPFRKLFTSLSLLPIIVLFTIFGCSSTTESSQHSADPGQAITPLGAEYRHELSGLIRGRITWDGQLPDVKPVPAAIPTFDGYVWQDKPNCFAPKISETRGIGEIAIQLIGVRPEQSRPWDIPPLTVCQHDYEIKVQQGQDRERSIGFVRRGEEVTVLSKDPIPSTIRFRGPGFFTLPFATPNQASIRRFNELGHVAISSGSLFVWANADLIVSETPYLTLTNDNGNYEIHGVPPGKYELIVWMRNWLVKKQERDPETGLPYRQTYFPPLVRKFSIVAKPGKTTKQDHQIRLNDFIPESTSESCLLD